MNRIHNLLLIILLGFNCFKSNAQAPEYDDLVFEEDSITTAFKPKGKNYIVVKSKRGTGGVHNTPEADSINKLKLPITDIILVYSETKLSDLANREDYNRSRWENLLITYPDLLKNTHITIEKYTHKYKHEFRGVGHEYGAH